MSGIRVSTWEKRIEVNDQGDCIVLNLNDSSLPDRFISMMDQFQEQTSQAKKKAKEIEDQCEAGSEAAIRATASLYRELHENVMRAVDGLFGPDTCKKVFGDIVPDIELFNDFFKQLIPYLEEFGQERAQRMSKYSANRTGNV